MLQIHCYEKSLCLLLFNLIFNSQTHLMTPCKWKFLPITFNQTTTLQPAQVLNPYLFNELIIMPGYCSSAFEPTNRSNQVPMGLQHGISILYSPFLNGTTIVPYPQMLCLPSQSTFQTSANSLGHPLMLVVTQWSSKGCSRQVFSASVDSVQNDSNFFFPAISFHYSPYIAETLTQNDCDQNIERMYALWIRIDDMTNLATNVQLRALVL